MRHASRLDVARPQWVVDAVRPYDTPLSPEGHGQARQAAVHLAGLAPYQHLFCSPFLRAVQTAAPIAAALGMKMKIEPGVGENYYTAYFPVKPEFEPWYMNAGDLVGEGLVDTQYRALVAPNHPETQATTVARARRAIFALLERFEGDLLIVTHGGIVHGLAKALVPTAVLLPHFAAIMEIRCDSAGRWSVSKDGSDLSHLEGNADSSILRMSKGIRDY
jgi:broad specificity phosphatase PhoE